MFRLFFASMTLAGLIFVLPLAAQQQSPPPQGQNKVPPAKDAANKEADKAATKTAGDFFRDA